MCVSEFFVKSHALFIFACVRFETIYILCLQLEALAVAVAWHGLAAVVDI